MKILIRYGDEEALCRVRETASVTCRIRIHVYPDGSVEIDAPPGRSHDQIQEAAQRRARWVFEHRNTAVRAREQCMLREYVSGETHFYLGRRHKLIVAQSPRNSSSVKLMRGRIEVLVPVIDPAAVRRRLNEWYLHRAEDYLSRKLADWASALPWVHKHPAMRLISMRTQWGSCSPDGVIHLNPALIRAPRHCIEYVVLHELCHLVEHNHSKKFYALLDRQMPQWRRAKSELDGLAELILADQ